MDCISSLSKLEILYLQQNFLTNISDSFRSLNKLVELRLDRNQISKIENLQSCSSLKKLDLSSNRIESLEGISGLHSLQVAIENILTIARSICNDIFYVFVYKELKISGNCIDTLIPLRALPAIKEIDISNNRLLSLEGLHQLPTLETFKADHNYISSLLISSLSAASTKRKGPDSKDSQVSSFSSAKSSNIHSKKSAAAAAASSVDKIEALPKRAESSLLELSLSGNKLKSLEGIELLTKSLEVLDVSFNFLQDSSSLLPFMEKTKKLTEIRLNGNPISTNEKAFAKLTSDICSLCPSVRAIDGQYFVSMEVVEVGKNNETTNRDQTSSDKKETTAKGGRTDISVSSSEFHTWEKGSESSVVSIIDGDWQDGDEDDDVSAQPKNEPANPPVASSNTLPTRIRSTYQSDSDSEDDDEDNTSSTKISKKVKKAALVDGEYDPKLENAADAIIAAPRLTLQSMKTPEQILEMETKFMDLVKDCKKLLHSSVFLFADEQHEKDAAKLAEILADQEANAVLVRDRVEEKEERRNSGSILEQQLQDLIDRPSVNRTTAAELHIPVVNASPKLTPRISPRIVEVKEEKEEQLPTPIQATVAEAVEDKKEIASAEKPNSSPTRRVSSVRKAPAPVNAAVNSILASGLTRHGTKLKSAAQGKVQVAASEDGLLLLSPTPGSLSSTLASQLENVKITRKEPKVFLNSKVVTFQEVSLGKSPSPNPKASERQEQEDSKTEEGGLPRKGFKRFTCATSEDPRQSFEQQFISSDRESIENNVMSTASNDFFGNEEVSPSNLKPSINDSDEKGARKDEDLDSDDGSVISVLREAADAIQGKFTPLQRDPLQPLQEFKGEDSEEEDEEQKAEDFSMIRVVNTQSFRDPSRKNSFSASASVVKVQNSPSLRVGLSGKNSAPKL